MKITKSQLKKIIKEELEVTLTNEEAGEMFGEEVQAQIEDQALLRENYTPYKVGDLINLLAKASPEAELAIRHRHAAGSFEVYEAYTTRDGKVIITVQERE